MVKHIVFMTLKDSADGKDKNGLALEIKEKLESLNGKIPGLIRLEIGVDISRTAVSGDLAIYSEFTDKDALVHYTNHPDHKAVQAFVASVRTGRMVVDYEI